MKVCVLGSGSNGNCVLIETDRSRILIDNGFGPKGLQRRLRSAGLPESGFQALLISHGHLDHCKGAGWFAEREAAPVFCNAGTRAEVSELRSLERCEIFRTSVAFKFRDFTIEPFPVPHDAADPVGFRITAGGVTGAVATDLGRIDDRVARQLGGCDWLVVESNHDEQMLEVSSYPWHLKQRLSSSRGHLSNRALASFLAHRYDGAARHVFLAHLSRRNNQPDIALDFARRALGLRSARSLHDIWDPCQVHLTYQDKPTSAVLL